MKGARSLVFFPGMGADARQFALQRGLPYSLITPEWIEPHDGETLPDYARRMAETVDWPPRFVLGGVSFGGMVAAELASHLRPDGLVLIATCLSPRSVPSANGFTKLLVKILPDLAVRSVGRISRPFRNVFGGFSEDDQTLYADMLAKTSVSFLRRVSQMIIEWEGVCELSCPSIRIHGGRDMVIPAKKVQPDLLIPDAGHPVNWTHAEQVNGAIREFVDGLPE